MVIARKVGSNPFHSEVFYKQPPRVQQFRCSCHGPRELVRSERESSGNAAGAQERAVHRGQTDLARELLVPWLKHRQEQSSIAQIQAGFFLSFSFAATQICIGWSTLSTLLRARAASKWMIPGPLSSGSGVRCHLNGPPGKAEVEGFGCAASPGAEPCDRVPHRLCVVGSGFSQVAEPSIQRVLLTIGSKQ